MKRYCWTILITLSVACASAPAGDAAPAWSGPYFGVAVGANDVSTDRYTSNTAFAWSLFAGYDEPVSSSIVLGGDVFFIQNEQQRHCVDDLPQSCEYFNPSFGSNVYGVDGRLGVPIGGSRSVMPYIKIGYGWVDGQGDVQASFAGSLRYGAGIDWQLGENLGVELEYAHQRTSDAVPSYIYHGPPTVYMVNNNLFVGIIWRF